MSRNYITKAISHEALREPSSAFQSYCMALEREESFNLDDYVNFSVLSFLFQDYGFSTMHDIPSAMVDKSEIFIFDSLEFAESKYKTCYQVEFWRCYYKMILYGHSYADTTWLSLIELGVIEACLCLNKSNPLRQSKREELMSLIKNQTTFRERYLQSIIE